MVAVGNFLTHLYYSLSEYTGGMPRSGHYVGELSPNYPLLGLVAHRPAHGFELHRRLINELGSIWHISQSQAYAILARLERDGLLAGSRVQQANRPNRNEFRLTDQGRARLDAWMMAPTVISPRALRVEFTTRLYFLSLLHPEFLRPAITDQQEAMLVVYELSKKTLVETDEDNVFNRLAVALRVRQLASLTEWLDDCQDSLRFYPTSQTAASRSFPTFALAIN